ncbi:MAG: hypothetical protein ACP5FR_02025 [Candidatus Micrarchaeia archaeon]
MGRANLHGKMDYAQVYKLLRKGLEGPELVIELYGLSTKCNKTALGMLGMLRNSNDEETSNIAKSLIYAIAMSYNLLRQEAVCMLTS